MKWNPKLLWAMQRKEAWLRRATYDVMTALRGPDIPPYPNENLKFIATAPLRGWAMVISDAECVGFMHKKAPTKKERKVILERIQNLQPVHCRFHLVVGWQAVERIERAWRWKERNPKARMIPLPKAKK